MPPATAHEPDPAALRDLAVAVAEEAGALLRRRLAVARTAVGTKSSPTDMVTEVDRESEALILDRLRAARPDDAVLAEEGGETDGTSGVVWVVDPLDGTTNYLYGFPAFAVSIAARVGGRTVAGAVHDAVHGETYAAATGMGATCDGRPITVSGATDIATALIGTGFAYDAARRARQAQTLTGVLPRVRDIRRAGSAALDLCWVACGRLDGYYEWGLGPWDLAAGELVVTEAGGVVTGLDGGPPRPGSVVAATPGIHAALLALVRDGPAAGP
jgi:myo-inositol-1(or 4)-monophosphatase